MYPRTARNQQRQWRFVVNLPGGEAGQPDFAQVWRVNCWCVDPVQAVRVERCVGTGQTCNVGGGGFQRTVCRQRYSYRQT